MKILFVIENYYPHVGGAEVVFKQLAEGLVNKGYEVDLVTHKAKDTKKFEVLNGVRIHRIPCLKSRYLFTFLSIPKVFSLAKSAHIIHTTTFNGAPPAFLASRILMKICVLTVHEVWVGNWKKLTEMNRFKAFVHDILERMIYLLEFDMYVAVSESTQKDLLRIGKKKAKTEVIYNAVDYSHWNPKRHDKEHIRKKLGLKKNFVCLFYGRPGISKGFEFLIRAVPMITKRIKHARILAIVSRDSAYQHRYEYMLRLIRKLGVEDKVIMHEPVNYKRLPAFVNAADCVVVPSLAEGFGFTAAESCAMGIPVIASDTTSLPEVVSGKYLFFEPRNHEDLANQVIKVYKGNYIKSRLKKFLIKDNLERYEELYKNLSALKQDSRA